MGYYFFIFDVMVCNDVYIVLLCDKIDIVNMYEIVIGGWLDFQLVIWDCKQCVYMDIVVYQNYFVDCFQYCFFWVSWINNIIKVGKGYDVGKNRFLIWNDIFFYDVNYVVVVIGFGVIGKWKFERSEKFFYFLLK